MLMSEVKLKNARDDVLHTQNDALQKKLSKAFLKPASFGLVAVSLAACGGASETSQSGLVDVAPETVAVTDTPTPAPDQNSGSETSPVKVSFEISNAGDAKLIDGGAFTTFDTVFHVSASFDASKVDGLKTINLGLAEDGSEMASAGRADFDGLKAETTAVNIHATQQDIELDFEKGSNSEIAINFAATTGPISVGSSHTSIEVIHNNGLVVDQQSDFDVIIAGATNVSGQTEHLVFKNDGALGDLTAGFGARVATVEEGGGLKTVLVDFTNGDAYLRAQDTVHGNGAWIDDITNLQTYTIRGHNSEIYAGSAGGYGAAFDLETIEIFLTGNASLNHKEIFANESKISLMEINASYANNIVVNTPFINGSYNVTIDDIEALSIAQQNIHLADGGNVLLENQIYEVGDQVFSGKGDILITAGQPNGFQAPGYVQTEAADASNHEGKITFHDNNGLDTFHGSTSDDTIVVDAFSFVGTTLAIYHDAEGEDTIEVRGNAGITIHDGASGSNDTVNATQSWSGYNIVFNTGSGDDVLNFSPFGMGFPFGPANILVDYGSHISGTVTANHYDLAYSEYSFDGLEGITNTASIAVNAGNTLAGGDLDDNSIYVLANGDVQVNGVSITNYVDLNDVAAFLNAIVTNTSETGDSAVFVINNDAANSGIGDAFDTYFYHVTENGDASGIDASEIVLLGMSTNVGSAVTTVHDIV